MKIWLRITNRIRYEIAKWNRPYIITGYRRPDGRYLKHTRIGNTTYITYKKNLDIADYVFISHFGFIEASHGITIEEGCQIGYHVTITSHSSHISIRLYGPAYYGRKDYTGHITGKVHIGKYSFIGPYSLILPGTRIGKGSLVAAYSHVKGEFPDFAIIRGNPAEVVGDTREMDKKYLDQHPELVKFYESWAGDA
ncbi:MAG: acyltransferase [Bacteroidota bacterium]|nr:acyltransferase [Bacteroidota bacterium]